MIFTELLKLIFLGIVEGITEWLPVSSTGHMLLVDEFIKTAMSDEFKPMFFTVIQLGAIFAVVAVFWERMFPFGFRPLTIKKDIFTVWFKVVLACVPGAVAMFTVDDWVDAHLSTPVVIAAALIFYGVLFIVLENRAKGKTPRVAELSDISWSTAFFIGLFQVLSIVPGTSRSGATIIGALILGVSRVAAAEFTFFLAVPVMLGASAVELIKYGFSLSPLETASLAVGAATAFIVSLFSVRFLMNYVKKHDFKVFGWYRIILGALVLVCRITRVFFKTENFLQITVITTN